MTKSIILTKTGLKLKIFNDFFNYKTPSLNWIVSQLDSRIKLIAFGIGGLFGGVFIGYFLHYTRQKGVTPPPATTLNPNNSPFIWSSYPEGQPFILVGKDFCSAWTIKDAIRDLFQNAMDSMLETHRSAHPECSKGCSHWISTEKPPCLWDEKKEWILPFFLYSETGKAESPSGYLCWKPATPDQGPILTLINLQATFSPNALIVGSTSKKDHSQNAGGHGEGLKAIAAVACRALLQFELFHTNVALKFYQNAGCCLFKCQKNSAQNLAFSALNQEYQKHLNLSFEKDVIAHVGKNQSLTFNDLQEAASQFLSLTHRQVRQLPTTEDLNGFKPMIVNSVPDLQGHSSTVFVKRSLLRGEDLNNKFYVQGILFSKQEVDSLKWGVNLTREDVRNRDRNSIDYSAASHILAQALIDLMLSSEKIAQEILQEYLSASPSARLPFYLEVLSHSPNIRQILTNLFKKTYPQARFVGPKDEKETKENTLFPRWCDESVVQLVHPALYRLIGANFPSPSAVRQECQDKLMQKKVAKTETTNLHQWMDANKEVLPLTNAKYSSFIEVRDSGTALDVPQFVVIENSSKTPRFKLIFSRRTITLDTQKTRFKFVKVVGKGVEEWLEKSGLTEKLPPPAVPPVLPPQPTPSSKIQASPPPVKSTPPILPTPEYNSKYKPQTSPPLHTEPRPATRNDTVPKENEMDCKDLELPTEETLSFHDLDIPSTSDSARLWEKLAKDSRSTLCAHLAITLCEKAVLLLSESGKKPALQFYLNKSSTARGFTTSKGAICINLASLIDLTTLPLFPSFKEEELKLHLKAHFLVLIAHEHAHFVDLSDGHGPDHGRRAEQNISKLLFHGNEF